MNRLFCRVLYSCVFLMIVFAFGVNAKTVNVLDFKTKDSDRDATPMVISALDFCKKNKVEKLIFPAGKYYFRKEFAREKYLYVSNNDEGLKRVVFDLTGMSNFEIDGSGAEFIFRGFLCPFLMNDSKNITLRNFSIDFVRTFNSEGEIISVNSNSIDIAISKEYPYKLDHNILIFVDDEGEKYPWSNLLEFDVNKKETAFGVPDYYGSANLPVKELEKGKIRIESPIKGTVGNKMVFSSAHRQVPAIIISDSKKVQLEDVTIFHSGGAGIIAQRSGDLFLNRIKITPNPQKDRIISCTADATHFSSCFGKIELVNCLFENQEDDASNIHGIYVRIEKILSENSVLVKLVHPQQLGDGFIHSNSKIEIVDKLSMNTKVVSVVKTTRKLNNELMVLTFTEKLSKSVIIGDAISQIEDYPEVLIKGCIIRNNRARGILLGSRAKTVIENNYFHTPGAAILFEGDASFWFEQAGVRDVNIRNNTFENCNFGVWGNACLQVGSGINSNVRKDSRYNKNIVVENNVFRIFDPRIVNFYSVDNFVFKNNKIEKTNDYTTKNPTAKAFITDDSSNVDIKE